MLVKRLGLEDDKFVKQCDKLFTKFLDSEGIYDNNYKKRESLNSFLNDLENENNTLLARVENKKGMKESVAHLTFLYVDENYRKQNIATNLINEYLKILKEKNISIIEVKSYKDNVAANKLYEKFGFNELWINYRKRI